MQTSKPVGRYLPTLDGWRTIAIALVLFSHASESILAAFPVTWLSDPQRLKHLGLLGVQVFFGLSGFLITSKLLEEEGQRGKISLRSFYIRRAFRILPAALTFLSVIGLLSLAGVLDVSLGRWLSTVFFAANYSAAEHTWYLGHFWSLAVEEHFYFLWPAAFLWLRSTRHRVILVLSLALLVALWRAVDFKFQVTGATAAMFWGRTDIQADGILWGVLLALLYADPSWKSRLRQWLCAPFTVPVIVAAVLLMESLPAPDWKLSFAWISVKAMLLPLLVLATLIQPTRWPGRILESALFRWVGRLSYSLYLWQQLFLVWDADRVPGLGLLQAFPLNLVAVFVCATLSLKLVETPCIAIGHRFAKSLRSG
ncbi:MAG: acyltransferase [Rhodoferax sp.]|nr:acyltransferase [Rhodoferax sp.]MCF8209021.1 acyltransferase [Rhodoferax sp.]